MVKELIQVKAGKYGFETLCEVNKDNTWIQGNGFTHKCNDILTALHSKYPEDEFRVLNM